MSLSAYDSTSSKVILFSADDELAWAPEIYLSSSSDNKTKELTLWSSNANNSRNAVSKFSARLIFYGHVQISIPIVNDEFDLNNAEIPDGVVIKYLLVDKTKYLYEARFQNRALLSKDELRLLRNEIFARHGYAFKSDDLKQYFQTQPWYIEIPNKRISERDLSKDELTALNQIKALESK